MYRLKSSPHDSSSAQTKDEKARKNEAHPACMIDCIYYVYPVAQTFLSDQPGIVDKHYQ
jgi:hypothetical protein